MSERTWPRNYPVKLPRNNEDPRFTVGLLYDIADLLERAGYPKLEPMDHVELRQAIFKFVYRTTN